MTSSHTANTHSCHQPFRVITNAQERDNPTFAHLNTASQFFAAIAQDGASVLRCIAYM